MSPDLKRLCEATHRCITQDHSGMEDADPSFSEAIVRVVLMELREVSGETNGYREGLWSRRNVDAMVQDILAETTEA